MKLFAPLAVLRPFNFIFAVALFVAAAVPVHADSIWSEETHQLAFGDFDGDGKTDVLYVANDPLQPSGIARSDGNSPTISHQTWSSTHLGITWHGKVFRPIVADFNGDNRADILMQRQAADVHYLLLTGANGQISTSPISIPNITGGQDWSGTAHRIVTGDFNGDNRDDIFLQATQTSGTNAVFLASSGGTFSSAQQTWPDLHANFNWSLPKSIIHAGDFNGDGKADLFVQSKGRIVIIDFEIPIPIPFFNTGAFGVVDAKAINGSGQIFYEPALQFWDKNYLGVNWAATGVEAVIGDFNGDNRADILLQALKVGGTNKLLMADSNGQFMAGDALLDATLRAATRDQYSIRAANFDGVGREGLYLRATTYTGTNYVVADATASNSSPAAHTAQSTTPALGRTAGNARVSDTGQATYSIPLFTPAGTNGMTPGLSLNYSSGGGNGLFGVGWSLSGLSGITRCGSTWAQDGLSRDVRNDSQDRFCLDGKKLRVVSGTYGADGSVYRTELETFSRITAYGTSGNGPSYFIAETKDGRVFEYGKTDDSRIVSVGQSTARFWAVSRIRDRSSLTDGNAIVFTYAVDTVNGAFRISTIKYSENTAQGVAAPYTVTFDYTNLPVGEVDRKFGMGAQINRIYRATHIDVTHSSGTLIRRYVLNFEGPLSPTSKSRLGSIQECAGSTSICFPPTSFTYQDSTAGLQAEQISSGSMPSLTQLPMDVNGDGREDIVYPSSATSGAGTWQVMYGTATGYGSPINTGITNTNPTSAIVIDYNADGREDLMTVHSGSTWWVMLGTSSGLAAPVNTNTTATTTGRGSNAHAMDVNGDGLDDLVWADIIGWAGGDAIRYRLRDLSGSFSAPANLVGPLPADQTITSGVFNPPRRLHLKRAPDFNGDGRADLTYLRTQRIYTGDDTPYFYSRSINAVYSNGASSAVGTPHGSTYPQYGDLNGDGLTDLIYAHGTEQICFRFSTGTGWSPEYLSSSIVGYGYPWYVMDWDADGKEDILSVHTTQQRFYLWRSTGLGFASPVDTGVAATNVDLIVVTDVNGDGLADLGIRKSGTWGARLHSGLAPDLLTSATDGFGVSHSFSYASISNYALYTKGTGAVFPMQDTARPMMVVTSLQSSDGTGTGNTYSLDNFTYEGARVDVQGRGFLGFSKKTWRDSRDATVEHRTYRQNFPYIGMVSNAKRTQGASGTAITEVDIDHSNHPYESGTSARYYPYVREVIERSRDPNYNNGALLSTKTITNTYDSSTGALTSASVLTSEPATGANGVNPNATWSEQVQVTSTFNDWPNWCFGRPEQVQQTRSHSLTHGAQRVRTTGSTWVGSYCRESQVVEEPNSSTLRVNTAIEYDDFGNLKQTTVTGVTSTGAAMTPRVTKIDYVDTTTHKGQFPLSITNALNEKSTFAWNYALALPQSTTDANGLQTSWAYDYFGQKTRETRPDSTFVTYDRYKCTNCDSRIKVYVDENVRALNGSSFSRGLAYLDMFGRSIYEYALRPDSEYNVTSRNFDARGRVAREYFPYALSGSPGAYSTIGYDLRDRVTSITRPTSDAVGAPSQTTNIYFEGLTSRIQDANGKNATRKFGANGLVYRSIDHNGYYQNFNYEAFDNLTSVVDDPGNPLQSAIYNDRGMLTSRTDMNMVDPWTFVSNSLGEVTSQTDAENQTTSYGYDLLGRMTSWVAGGVTYQFNFGSSAAAKNIGSLESMVVVGGYREDYLYDSLARPLKTTITADSIAYHFDYAYNSIGMVDTLEFPTSTPGHRLKLKYGYLYGQLNEIREFASSNGPLWRADTFNTRHQITRQTLGNGWQTNRAYDAVTGRLKSIQTGPGGGTGIQDLEYSWDLVGNLLSRMDKKQSNLTESFTYDDLYRLDKTYLNGAQTSDNNYNALGNLEFKTDVGNYVYDTARKHQVRSTNGVSNWSFNYNDNGNMTSGRGATINWTAFNYPAAISNGGLNSTFSYTPDRRYWKQVATFASGRTETTTYIGNLLEKVTVDGIDYYRHMIRAGDSVVVLSRDSQNPSLMTTVYGATDHLGSVSSLSTATPLNLSYGAFGVRRGSNWQGAPSAADLQGIANTTRRGFTDHTMLDNLQLIHMNGRMFDPVLARFMSPDPFVPEPLNTQSFNRYSYVRNNPLSFIDPSGFRETDPDDFGPGTVDHGGGFWSPRYGRPPQPPVGRSCSPNCPSPLPAQPVPDQAWFPADQMPEERPGYVLEEEEEGWFWWLVKGRWKHFENLVPSRGEFVSGANRLMGTTLDNYNNPEQQISVERTADVFEAKAYALSSVGEQYEYELAKQAVLGRVLGPEVVAARGVTRFINGVRVVDRRTGNVYEGTVDLKPTLDRIKSGERFPHRNDGGTFQNRPLPGKTTPELPARPEGYYREYVHPTPGVSGPGPQRVVTGQGGEMYYTPDHYGTFIPLN